MSILVKLFGHFHKGSDIFWVRLGSLGYLNELLLGFFYPVLNGFGITSTSLVLSILIQSAVTDIGKPTLNTAFDDANDLKSASSWRLVVRKHRLDLYLWSGSKSCKKNARVASVTFLVDYLAAIASANFKHAFRRRLARFC